MNILEISTILLLLSAATIVTAAGSGGTAAVTIYVDNTQGIDIPECLTKKVSCQSLHYVLTNFQWSRNTSLIICLKLFKLQIKMENYVPYEPYFGFGVFNINGGNLTLMGCMKDDVSPYVLVAPQGLEFTNFHSLAFTNLQFSSSMPIMHDGEFADFHNCRFFIADPMYYPSYSHSVQLITFLNCWFGYFIKGSPIIAASDVAHNPKNATFKDCIFQYLDKTFFFFPCEYVTFSDCQISYNNRISTNALAHMSKYEDYLITDDVNYNHNDLVAKFLLIEFPSIRLLVMNNMGTWIAIFQSRTPDLQLLNTDFINNTGIFTGGILFKQYFLESLTVKFINVSFKGHNSSTYREVSFIVDECYYDLSIELQTKLECTDLFFNFPGAILGLYLSTPAYHIDFSSSNSIALFPGKLISFPPMRVTDYFGNNVLCTATVSLMDNSNCQIDLKKQLTDDNYLLLETSLAEIITTFYLTSTQKCSLKGEPKLVLTCDRHASTSVNVTFKSTCPLGYSFNSSNEICIEENSDLVYDRTGTVCVPRNEWYGQMNISGEVTTVISPCTYPYCSANGGSCPIAGYTETHQVLPWTQNEQCNGLYGGVLCKDCVEKAVFTFGASKCVSLSGCKVWQPYAIIGLAAVGQILLALIMIHSRAKTESGVGYLYGPLFFLAVYKLLPISHSYVNTTAASPLEITVSLFESILLLDLDILGKLTWCFFPNLNQSLNYSFRFMGPLITFLVLLVIVLIARMNFFYKIINRFMQSPIQPICLLMVMSFWSLSKTSIEIIKPIIIKEKWRFSIQPEYEYLGNAFSIVLLCIAVVILGLVYLPFILLLFFSQPLRAKVNLSYIQPLLDAFQSSYKDSCRWYSGVYLLAWVILNINMPSYIFIIIIAGMIVLHSIVQPHKSTFLNAADVLLLINICILLFLSQSYNTDQVTTILKYPLLIIPLLYILCGGVWMIIRNQVQKPNLIQLIARLFQKNYQPLNNNTDDGSQVEMIIDSGNNDIHQQQVKPIVVSVAREPLIFDDDNN